MGLLTAQELRQRERPEFTIDLGNGDTVLARRPDLQLLVLQGVLPTPLLNDVVRLIGEWVGKDLADLSEDVIASSDKLLRFVDAMVCASLVCPVVVGTEPERTSPDMLLVSDLTVETKKTIVVKVCDSLAAPKVVAAAKDFPTRGPGEGAGPDVPALQAAAV